MRSIGDTDCVIVDPLSVSSKWHLSIRDQRRFEGMRDHRLTMLETNSLNTKIKTTELNDTEYLN